MKGMLGMAVLVSAVLAICGYYLGEQSRWIIYVFKPLTTILILTLAISPRSSIARYKAAVVAGLICSLAGDIFLMLPGDHFLAGLLSFLIAHLCYLIAFTAGAPLLCRKFPYVVLALLAGGILFVLWPGVPEQMRLPVIVYVVLLASMAAQAVTRWKLLPSAASACAAAGGLLFVVSDATLASERFGSPFPGATAVVLGTYYAAQFLIASSVEGVSSWAQQ